MTDSWWLKLKRAQKHMVDIDRAARRYASLNPYELVRVRDSHRERKVGYKVRITAQPDPMIAVMLGDFIHNLRSALDHIVVACVPKVRRNSAGFPIEFRDIWAKGADGQFVVNYSEAREKFASAIKGLPDAAIAVIKRYQPYHLGSGAHRATVGIISRLENADKHRQMIAIGGGVKYLALQILVRGLPLPVEVTGFTGRTFAKDDTIIGWEMPNRPAPDGTVINPSEVEMKFPSGTAVIVIKITRIGGNEPPSDFHLGQTMLAEVRTVRRILQRLEPFVRR